MADAGEHGTKKKHWGDLKGVWVEPDVRDTVVETMQMYAERTEMPVERLCAMADISRGKFYEWL